jgi:hypothetical protein
MGVTSQLPEKYSDKGSQAKGDWKYITFRMLVEIINRRLFYNQMGRKFGERSFHFIIAESSKYGDCTEFRALSSEGKSLRTQ